MEGTDDIYDLTPAPGTVTEEGTFLNVENLLKDTTAALLGGDSSMVPDEALVALKNLIDGLTPKKIGAAKIAIGSYVGAGKSGEENSLTFNFEPKFVLVTADSIREYRWLHLIRGMSITQTSQTYGSIDIRWAGNTVYWKTLAENNPSVQMNNNGVTYFYVAVG